MADIKESTKARSKAVTSPITPSRQALNALQNTKDGVKRLTEAEAEKLRDLLARVLDVMNSWPCRLNGKMPKPQFIKGYMLLAFPIDHHVIQNAVTSEGKQNFTVDDVTVIPEPVQCDGGQPGA